MNDQPEQPIIVREALPADAREIIRLLALLDRSPPAGDPAAQLSAFLSQKDNRVLVAVRAEQTPTKHLLGVITLHVMSVLHRPGPIGRLSALIVDEHARGQGVGRALVRAAEAIFTAHSCALIEVTSNKTRTNAHTFYEQLGYTSTSFRFAKPLPSANP